MTRAVIVHADAAAELEAAAIWYDDQRDGFGLRFLAAVDRIIQHARAWPHTGAFVDPEHAAHVRVAGSWGCSTSSGGGEGW